MKQKLLNLFTWRATLLVALLCTSFGNAWGEDKSTTLTFSSSATSVSAADDDVTWGISGNSYDSSDKAWSSGKKGSSCTFTTTSSIKGIITRIDVNAKGSDAKGKVKVEISGSVVAEKNAPNGSYNVLEFTSSSSSIEVNGTDKIVVTGTSGSNGGGNVYIKSITVYYESDPQFTISPDCHGYYEETHSAIKYFGTYSYEYPFKVPAAGNNDLKVSTVSVSSSGVLTLNALEEGTIVPANTGVLVSALSAGTYIATPTLASGNAISGNLLKGSIEMPSTTPNGTKYYCLSMKNGNIGFYYGGENGGRFDMPANRAFLAVSGGGIKGFSFSDMVDGIKAVETAETEDKAIYNLAGQRVSKMQKGIYVVNGKKVLVK